MRYLHLALGGVLAALAFPAAAQAAIEVDHGIEFVSLADMPDGSLRLEVTDSTGAALGFKQFTGDIELNHDGPPCFDGDSTPDLRPGDVLTVREDVVDGAVVETYTIADVTYAMRFDPASPGDPLAAPPVPATPDTLVIQGSVPAGQAANTEVRLGGEFADDTVVEGGTLNQNRGNRLLITPDADSFTIRISPVVEANVAEVIVGVGADGDNITMFSGQTEFAPPGCPPLDTTRGPITLPELPPAPVPPGDADGDGVINPNDDCPNTSGPAGNDGCPVPSVLVPGPAVQVPVLQRPQAAVSTAPPVRLRSATAGLSIRNGVLRGRTAQGTVLTVRKSGRFVRRLVVSGQVTRRLARARGRYTVKVTAPGRTTGVRAFTVR